jgi:multicomponent Na+:H+ antiporter subunit C
MMSSATIFGLCGAALIGLGLYGFVMQAHLLRRLLAFNVIGSGIFLLFGATAAQMSGEATDPVPQALIITGIVVALVATALGVGLVLAYARATGRSSLPEDDAPGEAQHHPEPHDPVR